MKIISVGSNPHQGIAYLPDGTMVVVDAADRYAGKNETIEIEFVRYLQTNAGKMMFARISEQRKTKLNNKKHKQSLGRSKPKATRKK